MWDNFETINFSKKLRVLNTNTNTTDYLSYNYIVSAMVPVESASFPPCNLPSFCFAVYQLSLLKVMCYLIKIS